MYSRLIVAIVAALAAWFAQGWRLGEQMQEQARDLAEQRNEQTRLVLQAERNRHAQLAEADRAARTREAGLRRDADAARTELDRLRDASGAAVGMSGESHGACLDRVAAFRDVFDQCAARYGGLAEKAGRHASDVKTLIDAWPSDGAKAVPSMAPSASAPQE